jgi:hypothetical protein
LQSWLARVVKKILLMVSRTRQKRR